MAGSSESRRWLPGGLGTSTSAEVRGSREPLLGLRPLHLCRCVQCPLQLIELTLPGALSARCGRWYVWPLWCSSWCRWRRSLRRSGLLLQPQQVQLRLCGCSTGLLEVQLILQLANAGAAALLRRCHWQNVLRIPFRLGARTYKVNTATGALNTCIDTLYQPLSEYTLEYMWYNTFHPNPAPPTWRS